VGILFALLGWLEIIEQGWNLPLHSLGPIIAEFGVAAFGPEDVPNAWLLLAYHATLAATLLCVGLIDYDGHRVPLRFWLALLCWGLAAPLVWPGLHPLSLVAPLPKLLAEHTLLRGAADGLAGAVVGILLGTLMAGSGRQQPFAAVPDKAHDPAEVAAPAGLNTNGIVALTIAGGFLGWQAACWITVGGFIIHQLAAPLQRLRNVQFIGAAPCIGMAGWLLLVSWRWITLAEMRWLPGAWTLPVAAVLCACAAGWRRARRTIAA
jgi:hypothetical protein